jgi:hypothetical protein
MTPRNDSGLVGDNRDSGAYKVKIDGNKYAFGDPVVTGSQLLTAAGLHPLDEHLIYQRLTSGQFEEVRLEETVDLSQPGLEKFKTFRSGESYRLTVDGRRFEWGAPEITGRMLKQFAAVDPNSFDVWLDVRGQGEDRVVVDNESVRLDEPGVERFYTAEISFTIVVNGRSRTVNTRRLSFFEVVQLAFPDSQTAPNTIYTVVYKNGPDENPQGSLVEGQIVTLKERMIINVTKTDKS